MPIAEACPVSPYGSNGGLSGYPVCLKSDFPIGTGTAIGSRVFQPATVLRGVVVMTSKAVIGIAIAAGCAIAFGSAPSKAQLFTNGPQANPGDYDYWSAPRNNSASVQYERLLQANPGFRQARMQR